MPDPTEFRPPCPPIECDVCRRNLDRAKAQHWESTAIHLGMPPTRYGVLMVRVKCHGQQQDMAATFDWLCEHSNEPMIAFADKPKDYGLKLLIERDGFSLPTELRPCMHQLRLPGEQVIDPELAERGLQPIKFSRWPHLDERFLDWMENEMISLQGEMLREIDPHALTTANAIKCNVLNLVDVVKKSMREFQPTAKVSRLSAQIACMLMLLNEKIGTPRTRPKEWINDVLPGAPQQKKEIKEWNE